MINKLNFSRLLFLVVVLSIFVFSSCRKDKLEDVEKDHQETEIQTNADLEFFLSREKTYELLAPSTFNWEKPSNQVSNRNDAISELQAVIIDVNSHLSEIYVSRLINKVGYPLWDASVVQLLDDDSGYTLFTPIFKSGSDKINALFIFTSYANGKTAYSLTSREAMESNAMNVRDPNFFVKTNLFQYYDKLLFNYEPPIYESWKDLIGVDVIDCFSMFYFKQDDSGSPIIDIIDTGVTTCSDGCWDNLYSSVIDTSPERNWASGHCEYTNALNDFWETSDLEHRDAITQYFLNVFMSFDTEELNAMGTFEIFEAWLNNPLNSTNINSQYNSFFESNSIPASFGVFAAECIDAGGNLDNNCSLHTYVEKIVGIPESGPDHNVVFNFMNTFEFSSDVLAYSELIKGWKTEDSAIRWDRSADLYTYIDSDIDALINCGETLPDFGFWTDLAEFTPPQNILDKIAAQGPGWSLQGLLTPTLAPRVNKDYFSTTITQMPEYPDGVVYTMEELFYEIRTNINLFVDITFSEFNPLNEDELSLWQSDNPEGTIISISIPGDDGSVICSQYNNGCCWIFSTVTAPFTPTEMDGFHPVSGNRQFGYIDHGGGVMEIYTKGVDRLWFPEPTGEDVEEIDLEITRIVLFLVEQVSFNQGADNLWESFQQGILNKAGEGNATINAPDIHRPYMGEDLKNLLKQAEPINYIPCSN